MLDIQYTLLINEYVKLSIDLENVLKSLQGFETSDTYEKTALLLNDVLQKIDILKAERKKKYYSK